jgi:hypothetical protein
MPFTPFHMGPGLAVKAVFGRYFSLMVFGFSQVAIDIEPLVRIIRGDAVFTVSRTPTWAQRLSLLYRWLSVVRSASSSSTS